MTYRILNSQQVGDTIVSSVEYNISGSIVMVDVATFLPKTDQDVIDMIIQRAYYEQSRLLSESVIPTIIETLPTDDQPIPSGTYRVIDENQI